MADSYAFVSGEEIPGGAELWRPDISSIGNFYPADYAGYMTEDDRILSCPALSEDGNVLFLALHNEDAGDYSEESDLIAFDVSNPANVSEIGRFRTNYIIEQSGIADILVYGDELFLSINGGISSIDVSNPASMSHNWSERGSPINHENYTIVDGTLYGADPSPFNMGWADMDNLESATYRNDRDFLLKENENQFTGINRDPMGGPFIYAVIRADDLTQSDRFDVGVSAGGGAMTLYVGGGGEPFFVGWSPLTTLIQMKCSRFIAARPTVGSYATVVDQSEIAVYHTD